MNQIDLKGRVAVITGGAQGIGYACAERMLRSGAAVQLWDIDAGLLGAAAERLGTLGRVGTAVVELSDEAAVTAAAAQAVAAHGRIDILVNNAGTWYFAVQAYTADGSESALTTPVYKVIK